MAQQFAPIVLPGFSQSSSDVSARLLHVPTLSELTARLGALPPDALRAAVSAEPDIYAATIAEAAETAAYLRQLADSFTALADRLTGIGGGQ